MDKMEIINKEEEARKKIQEILKRSSSVEKYYIGCCVNKVNGEQLLNVIYFSSNNPVGTEILATSYFNLLKKLEKLLEAESLEGEKLLEGGKGNDF